MIKIVKINLKWLKCLQMQQYKYIFFSIFLNLKELVEVTKREEIQDA